MHRTLLALAGLASLALAGCGKARLPAARERPAADPPRVTKATSSPLTGTPSCSGRGCHGELERPDAAAWRVAYTRWLHHDPHTNAYRVLEGDRGREIGRKLGIEDVTKHTPCLACHTTPQAAVGSDELAVQERGYGVGCESCHGAARDWLEEHRDKEWKKKLADAGELGGMNALDKHARRAAVCAGCHVGAPADPKRGLPLRDMNHDMIAAGHPRLIFEYGSYLANLPRHWGARKLDADHEGAWLVGQLASAKAAMVLLADRAARAKTDPWPELSEHDCYACHHGLHGKSWRQERGYRNTAGAVPANRWYTAMAPVINSSLGGPKWDRQGLDRLLARRYPPAQQVRAEALKLAQRLDERARAAEKPPGRDAIASLGERLLRFGAGPEPHGWDEYEQAALGLAALGGAKKPNVEAILRRLALPDRDSGPDDSPPLDLPAAMRKLFGP